MKLISQGFRPDMVILDYIDCVQSSKQFKESWDAEGNVVILAEGDGFYIIINNGWEMKVRTKDLNTGETRTIVANEKNPAIEAEGNNIAVRLLAIKGDGVSFSYPA